MIEKILLGLGLVIIPFATFPGLDTREPKMITAMLFALALNLWVFYKGKFKSINNKWLYIFIGYLFLQTFFIPKVSVTVLGLEVINLWTWRAIYSITIFLTLLITISSIRFTKEEINKLLLISCWIGFVMSLYAILQFFGIDQFFTVKDADVFRSVPSARVGGTLGQPTILAPFLVMIIPLSIYLRKYLMTLSMIIAVIFTQSQLAIVALCMTLLFILSMKNKKLLITCIGIVILICSVLVIFPKTRNLIDSSGRFGYWPTIIKDVNSSLTENTEPRYPFTGLGAGSFQYLYHAKHKTEGVILQAHNDYLQVLYEFGYIGLTIFLCMIFTFLKNNFRFFADMYHTCLWASFFGIALCAAGTFVWQLGAHIYYTIFIVGLLNNKED